MKIFVLGSKGMLGRYVTKFLQLYPYYEIIELNRNVIDAAEMTHDRFRTKMNIWGLIEGDVIINCMGIIKPKVEIEGDLKTILINSIFPRVVADICKEMGAHMIHPTTDCVFSGERGLYSEVDIFDVGDIYGMSKAMGEPPTATCIRTSIIGEEVGQSRSLVEWIKSNANKTVNGYINHFWNGMTCLQFAKVCKHIIDTKLYWLGVRHLHSNIHDKRELVSMISDVYNLNVTVNPKEAEKCDRTLCSVYSAGERFAIPSLYQQILDMRDFSDILYM